MTRKRPRPPSEVKSPPRPAATVTAATPAATSAVTSATTSSAAADVSAPPSAILLHRQLPRLPLPAGAPSSSLSAFGRLAELGAYLSLDGLEPLSSAAPVGITCTHGDLLYLLGVAAVRAANPTSTATRSLTFTLNPTLTPPSSYSPNRSRCAAGTVAWCCGAAAAWSARRRRSRGGAPMLQRGRVASPPRSDGAAAQAAAQTAAAAVAGRWRRQLPSPPRRRRAAEGGEGRGAAVAAARHLLRHGPPRASSGAAAARRRVLPARCQPRRPSRPRTTPMPWRARSAQVRSSLHQTMHIHQSIFIFRYYCPLNFLHICKPLPSSQTGRELL